MPKLTDLLSLGTLCAVKGGRWSGSFTGGAEDLGLKLSPEAEQSLRIVWTLIHSRNFRQVDSIRSRAYGILDSYAMNIPINLAVQLRMVRNDVLDGVMQQLAELKEDHNRCADEFCTTRYPVLVTENKERLMKEAAERWVQLQNIEGIPPEAEFLDNFRALIDTKFPTTQRLRKSMYLYYGSFSLQLSDALDAEAPVSEAVTAMVKGLRKNLRERLKKGVNQILSSDRYSGKSLQSLRRDLEKVMFKNVLDDDAVRSGAAKALELLQGREPREVKVQQDAIKAQLEVVMASVEDPSEVEILDLQQRLETAGARRLRT